MFDMNENEEEGKNNDENQSNEKNAEENYIKEIIPQIIEKGIEILNDTGNKIQFFKKQLKQIDDSLKNDKDLIQIKNIKEEINYIRNKLGKKTLTELLNKEKEIFLNLTLLTKLFPSNIDIPEKIFNTNVFLEICFIDLINSHKKILDMDISGQVILYQYNKYLNKSDEFLISKKKYLISLLKLSITMLDANNDEYILTPTQEKDEININIFDLKKYVKNLLDFIDKMITNKKIFDDDFKSSIMPGLISKLTKLINSKIKITSKMIEKICAIQNEYIEILFNKNEQKEICDNDKNILNKKKFCEFYEVFILILFDKYKNKIIGNVLEIIIKMNINYFQYLNTDKYINLIGAKFFENIFYIINNQIFDELNNSIINSNSIYAQFDNFKNYENIYITYVKNALFKIEQKNKKINELINIIENAYIKKEFIKFNKNLIELLGTIKLVLHYNHINNINNILYENLFSFFGKIIKINKNKIFFETINSYEFIFLNINIPLCKNNIISEFFKSVLNTYNSEYKLSLLFIFFNDIYKSFPEIYNFFFDACLNNVIDITKKFNNKLTKKKFTTYTQLNDCFNEVLNSFILFEFIILFLPGQKKNLEKKEIKKIISLINFFYDLFIDTDNEENFNKAKINDTKLSLVNLFLMNLIIFVIEKNSDYLIEQKNRIILLSMFNYSNNAKIIKYSSSLLILNINKGKDLKNFIKTNYTFLINSILNKIIYFNIESNMNKKELFFPQKNNINNYHHLRNIILNVFSSLIELINNFYLDDDINKIFVLEFYNYTEKLFPYFDNNIKEKNANVIDIMLEIFIKISLFQKNVLNNECNKLNIDITKLNIDVVRLTSEEFFDEKIETKNDTEFVKKLKNLKKKLQLQKCNICRKLILRFLPLILSRNIIFISKSFQIIKNYILMLFLLPMSKEEEENFSEEDPNNVIISSSLGPIMYELWQPIMFSFNRNIINLSLFNSFFEIFDEIANFYPEFFDGEKIFKYLIPNLNEKLGFFLKEYKEGQILSCFRNVLNFLKKIFVKNQYNKKYKNDFGKFIDEYKKYFYMGYDENKKSDIDKNIKKMMFSFTKT